MVRWESIKEEIEICILFYIKAQLVLSRDLHYTHSKLPKVEIRSIPSSVGETVRHKYVSPRVHIYIFALPLCFLTLKTCHQLKNKDKTDKHVKNFTGESNIRN